MPKIFSAKQIKEWDQFTINNEPISSLDLMERASLTFVKWFEGKFKQNTKVLIFCGPGNNGGDGLAIARLLLRRFFEPEVFMVLPQAKSSPDAQANLDKLPRDIKVHKGIPSSLDCDKETIIIDAIFGSGLSREIEGELSDFVLQLNQLSGTRISVDIPSGLFADKPSTGTIFKADYTFTFQAPKLAFLLSENAEHIGQFIIGDIGLSEAFHIEKKSRNHFTDFKEAKALFKQRNIKFSHKGTYGHALISAGSYGKAGAATLCVNACLRSGVGLTTCLTEEPVTNILQISAPEAMCTDLQNLQALEKFNALACGPGWSNTTERKQLLLHLLDSFKGKIVLDADALNIIAEDGSLHIIPKDTILTPHPKEFDRLFGASNSPWERMEKASQKSVELGIVIVVKGAHTSIHLPNGNVHFNSTGNPGMATGGSGDVLTGIIVALLAQGYSPEHAAILGVYIHGLAGDIAVSEYGKTAMKAGDIITALPKAFLRFERK